MNKGNIKLSMSLNNGSLDCITIYVFDCNDESEYISFAASDSGENIKVFSSKQLFKNGNKTHIVMPEEKLEILSNVYSYSDIEEFVSNMFILNANEFSQSDYFEVNYENISNIPFVDSIYGTLSNIENI